MSYNPLLKARIEESRERRQPDVNRELLVPYGIRILDKNFFGIDPLRNGELVLIIAEEKNRKTTLMINIIINVCINKNVVRPRKWVIDTLESGMNEARYTDQMIVNLASRYLIDTGHKPISAGFCPACGSRECKELVLKPEYLSLFKLTPQQKKSVERAEEEMMTWPVMIFDASLEKGDTRNLPAAVDMSDAHSRWRILAEEKGYDTFVSDHLQQYRFGFETQTDYEKMLRAMNAHGDFVASTGTVVFDISQVSLTSIREAKSGGKLTASGGRKGHQEATKVIASSYENDSGKVGISIESSRVSSVGFGEYLIDDISGAMYEP